MEPEFGPNPFANAMILYRMGINPSNPYGQSILQYETESWAIQQALGLSVEQAISMNPNPGPIRVLSAAASESSGNYGLLPGSGAFPAPQDLPGTVSYPPNPHPEYGPFDDTAMPSGPGPFSTLPNGSVIPHQEEAPNPFFIIPIPGAPDPWGGESI